jgi:hypothetical protein
MNRQDGLLSKRRTVGGYSLFSGWDVVVQVVSSVGIANNLDLPIFLMLLDKEVIVRDRSCSC